MANHDDILENKQKIENKIQELEGLRESVFPAAEAKSNALGEYRKQKALTILKLRNEVIKSFEGEIIKYPLPITIMRDIAAGICWKEKMDQDEAEGMYKGLITILDATKAELNGLQSINRRME
jgi:hypothetical protein